MLYIKENLVIQSIEVLSISGYAVFMPRYLNTKTNDSYVSDHHFTLTSLINYLNESYGIPKRKIVDFLLTERMQSF